MSGGTLFELELLRKENAQLRKDLDREVGDARCGLAVPSAGATCIAPGSAKQSAGGFNPVISSVTLLPDSEWLEYMVCDITPGTDSQGGVAAGDQVIPALCAAAEAGAKNPSFARW